MHRKRIVVALTLVFAVPLELCAAGDADPSTTRPASSSTQPTSADTKRSGTASGMTKAQLDLYLGHQVWNLRLFPKNPRYYPKNPLVHAVDPDPPSKKAAVPRDKPVNRSNDPWSGKADHGQQDNPITQTNEFGVRCEAADNLRMLGPEAAAAIPDLVYVVLQGAGDSDLERKVIDALVAIGLPTDAWRGTNPSLAAVVHAQFQTADVGDPKPWHPAEEWDRIAKLRLLRTAADDALLKLLPEAGKSLTMDDAMLLSKLYPSCSEQVATAIEKAWADRPFTHEALAQEAKRRQIEEQRDAKYWLIRYPDGRVVKEPKPPWILWREANPKEAEAEIAEAARQTRAANDRLKNIQLRDPDKVVSTPDGSKHVIRKYPWEP